MSMYTLVNVQADKLTIRETVASRIKHTDFTHFQDFKLAYIKYFLDGQFVGISIARGLTFCQVYQYN